MSQQNMLFSKYFLLLSMTCFSAFHVSFAISIKKNRHVTTKHAFQQILCFSAFHVSLTISVKKIALSQQFILAPWFIFAPRIKGKCLPCIHQVPEGGQSGNLRNSSNSHPMSATLGSHCLHFPLRLPWRIPTRFTRLPKVADRCRLRYQCWLTLVGSKG